MAEIIESNDLMFSNLQSLLSRSTKLRKEGQYIQARIFEDHAHRLYNKYFHSAAEAPSFKALITQIENNGVIVVETKPDTLTVKVGTLDLLRRRAKSRVHRTSSNNAVVVFGRASQSKERTTGNRRTTRSKKKTSKVAKILR